MTKAANLPMNTSIKTTAPNLNAVKADAKARTEHTINSFFVTQRSPLVVLDSCGPSCEDDSVMCQGNYRTKVKCTPIQIQPLPEFRSKIPAY